jgi:hypothetical protein
MKLCGLMVLMLAAILAGCSGVVSQTPAGSERSITSSARCRNASEIVRSERMASSRADVRLRAEASLVPPLHAPARPTKSAGISAGAVSPLGGGCGIIGGLIFQAPASAPDKAAPALARLLRVVGSQTLPALTARKRNWRNDQVMWCLRLIAAHGDRAPGTAVPHRRQVAAHSL